MAALLLVVALPLGVDPAAAADGAPTIEETERAVATFERGGTRSREYVTTLTELGRLYRAAGDFPRAEDTLAKAARQSALILGADDPDTAAAIQNVGDLLADRGEYGRARKAYERALAIRESSLGRDHPATARTLNNLALVLVKMNEGDAAISLLDRVVTIHERHFGSAHPTTAIGLITLGTLHFQRGELPAAERCLARALEIRSRALGDHHPSTAAAQRTLAEVHLAMDLPSKAEPLLDTAIAVLRRTVGDDHPETTAAIDLAIQASRRMEDRDEREAGSEPAARGRRRLYLRELLGLEWKDELITFPFRTAAGECRDDAVHLEGPDGPVPVQLVDVEHWPDGSVRCAKACFFVNLAAFTCNRYTLRYAAEPIQSPPAAQGTLQVARDGDHATVRSRHLGMVCNLASGDMRRTDNHPIGGPVVALLDADGGRFGGSELYGPSLPRSVEAEVIDAGPVLATVRWCYRYEGGLTFDLRARLGERDNAIYWEMRVTGHAPTTGWRLRINQPDTSVTAAFQKKAFTAYPDVPAIAAAGELDWVKLPLRPGRRPFGLAPWFQQAFDDQQTVLLLESGHWPQPFFAAVRKAGDWVEPIWPRRFGESYPARLAKSLPLRVFDDGSVMLEANCHTQPGGGVRHWTTGMCRAEQSQVLAGMIEHARRLNASTDLGKWFEPRLHDLLDGRRLDTVKNYVLRWTRTSKHPSLFVTHADTERAREERLPLPAPPQAPQFGTFDAFLGHLVNSNDGPNDEPWHNDAYATVAFLRGDKSGAEMRMRDRVLHHLGLLGQIDRMRDAGIVASLYDGVIDSTLVGERDARRLDAWMTYLCYLYADPNIISYERGYHPGPPNITISYVINLGVCACAVPDHPLAREWLDRTMEKVRFWLDEELGPQGEWLEGSHYDHVTFSQFLALAIAMRNAGFDDLTRDPRLRAFAECLAQYDTPPDPTRGGHRVTPPLGRRAAGQSWAMAGLMSRLAMDKTDGFARRMQWAWMQGGSSYRYPDERLGGMQMLLLDPSMRSSAPTWGSRYYPRSGVVFREGVGTRREGYLLIPTFWGEALAPLQVGSVVKWFAHGTPLGGAFADGDAARHPLLASHVLPAAAPATAEQWAALSQLYAKGEVLDSASEPLVDYLDARFTTAGWEPSPPKAGAHAKHDLPPWPGVPRDGQGPVSWRRRLLAVKSTGQGTPSYLVLRDSVETETPTVWQFWSLTRGLGPARQPPLDLGKTTRQPTALEGDIFTGCGQHGTDLDFFVAAPRETPRTTLRWGQFPSAGSTEPSEYQDLLHLQLSGSGSYFVVLFPRTPTTQRPRFRALGHNGILIQGDWGEDLVFFGNGPAREEQCDIELDAPACVVRRETGRQTICLPAGGKCVSIGAAVSSPASTSRIFTTPHISRGGPASEEK